MSHYWLNKTEILQKAKEKYGNCGGKGKAAEYYKTNKDVLKEKARKSTKIYQKKKKKQKKSTATIGIKNEKKKQIYFYSIKMSEQTLKFDHILVNKKDFHASKQAIASDLVESSKHNVSDKFKHNKNGFKHFIGYLHIDDVIRPLGIVLPTMSGYIKYFDDGGKNMSFLIEDEDVYLKCSEIWNKIKMLPGVKLHSQPIYDGKYIKPKAKTFNCMINTLFSEHEIPKERNHCICIAEKLSSSLFRAMQIQNKKERISQFY